MPAPDHLNGLKALEAAVRLGSFAAAGTEMGVTSAAVGQRVRNLEKALGRRLLIRHANGFEPTEAALAAAGKLREGFDRLSEAMVVLNPAPMASRIAISIVPTIADRWLAPRLASFLTEFPNIDLRIDSTHQVYDPPGAEYDFVLRYAPPAQDGRREIELFREALVPVCTPELGAIIAKAGGSLKGVKLIHVERETSDTDWLYWPEWGRRFGHPLPDADQGLWFTRTTLALRAMYAGNGVLPAQLSIVLPDILSGRLVAPIGPERCAWTGYPYRLIVLNGGAMPPLHKSFIAWLRRESEKSSAAMEAYLGTAAPSAAA